MVWDFESIVNHHISKVINQLPKPVLNDHSFPPLPSSLAYTFSITAFPFIGNWVVLIYHFPLLSVLSLENTLFSSSTLFLSCTSSSGLGLVKGPHFSLGPALTHPSNHFGSFVPTLGSLFLSGIPLSAEPSSQLLSPCDMRDTELNKTGFCVAPLLLLSPLFSFLSSETPTQL